MLCAYGPLHPAKGLAFSRVMKFLCGFTLSLQKSPNGSIYRAANVISNCQNRGGNIILADSRVSLAVYQRLFVNLWGIIPKSNNE